MSDDKIKKLPVRFKTAGKSGQVLELKHVRECLHFMEPQSFLIDRELAAVECGKCGQSLNPMVVLQWLAQDETRWHISREQYQDEMRRLKARSRTKCRHCGEMTPVSHR